MSSPHGGVDLVKLGGSLITDKQRSSTLRPEVLEALAGELARLAEKRPGRLVVGHGSGSFGHAAAREAGLGEGSAGATSRRGIVRTQLQAARLHRHVVEALDRAGACPWSLPPSSSALADGGHMVEWATGVLVRGLELELLPVVHGDVLLDRSRGATIASTESLFLRLAEELPQWGLPVGRAFWLGETPGVYDEDGETIPTLTLPELERLASRTRGAAGPDVTGGMRHRLETAAALARLGIPSWIGDGRDPTHLRHAVSGEEVPGTWIPARPPDP